jgi:hypothetical protein
VHVGLLAAAREGPRHGGRCDAMGSGKTLGFQRVGEGMMTCLAAQQSLIGMEMARIRIPFEYFWEDIQFFCRIRIWIRIIIEYQCKMNSSNSNSHSGIYSIYR